VENEEVKEEINLVSKPAEELNREFLESLPKDEKMEKAMKISVKPVEKLIEPGVKKLFEDETKPTLKDEEANRVNHKVDLGESSSAYEPRYS
jgi:hypothetical protein